MSSPAPTPVDPQLQSATEAFRHDCQLVRAEIAKSIVGHYDIIEGLLTCLFAGGHALLEGVPGLGKTALVRALASALDLKFTRIQFTPDLMPADILGTNVLSENELGRRSFNFVAGPVFGQIVLADEINRASPKTQSALLEAMQERQVTAGGQTRRLPEPFLVLATQNPLEQEGTYPLPEAQLDRFFFKLLVRYSKREELMEILNRTTAQPAATIAPVLDAPRIIAHQALVRRVIIAPHVQDYAVRCALATHPRGPHAIEIVNKYVRVGVSPRAAQAMVLAAKVRTLLQGRYHAAAEDVQAAAPAALRHRIILNFQAEAEGIDADAIVTQVINQTPRTLS